MHFKQMKRKKGLEMLIKGIWQCGKDFDFFPGGVDKQGNKEN
jgi:hypothetical protein